MFVNSYLIFYHMNNFNSLEEKKKKFIFLHIKCLLLISSFVVYEEKFEKKK